MTMVVRVIFVLLLLMRSYLSSSSGCPDFSFITTDSNGNAWAALQVAISGSQSVIKLAYQPFGGGMQTPFTISDPSLSSESPLLSVNSSGDAIACWATYDPKNKLYAIYASTLQAGQSWITPIRLSQTTENYMSGQTAIIITDLGKAAIFWVGYDFVSDCVALYRAIFDVSQSGNSVAKLSDTDENVFKDYTLHYTVDGKFVVAWDSYIFQTGSTAFNMLSGDVNGSVHTKTRVILQ